MAETSITSSPSKLNGSIRETRLKRRNKRLKIDQSLQFKSDQKEKDVCFRNMLNEFYNDSGDESTNIKSEKSAVIKNFKPFQMEKALAMADQIFIQQSSSNITNVFPETQGFITCTELNEINNKYCCTNKKDENRESESFIITETELINCCDQAEQLLDSFISKQGDDGTHPESTPIKNDSMILVNSILEDFSQSPLRKEQIITNTSWQYTPEFRLRRLPVRSYSRKHIKTTRANLNQRFEQPDIRKPSVDDDSISFCSSLSVQEDNIYGETPNNQSLATSLDNTDRLCENLLNLTEYFTQNEINQSFTAERKYRDSPCSSNKNNETDPNLLKISDLMNEILSLRSLHSKTCDDDSYNSTEDFHGFGSSNSEVKQSESLAEFDLGHASSAKVTKVDIPFDDWSEEDIFADLNTENILLQNNIQIVNKQNVEVLDELNHESRNQDATFTIPNVPISNPAFDSTISCNTASAKPIKVSRDAHIMSAKIPRNLIGIPVSAEIEPLHNCDYRAVEKDENVFENPEDFDDEWNDDCDLFINFQTPASFKENFVKNTQQHLQELIEISQYKHDDPCTSKSTTLGFTTAAGKNVCITDKGLSVAQSLLTEIAGEVNDSRNYEEELKERKFQVYAKTHNLDVQRSSLSDIKQLNKDQNFQNDKQDPPNIVNEAAKGYENDLETIRTEIKQSKSEFVIFSEKNITKPSHIAAVELLEPQTNEAVDKICKFFETTTAKVNKAVKSLTVEELGGTKNQETQLFDKHSKEINISMGFQTANGKKVCISAKAKQMADNLLKEFNVDKDIETCEKDLKDMKTKLYIKNKDLKEKPDSLQFEESDYNNLKGNELIEINHKLNNELFENHNLNTNVYMGFQTANGQQVSISVKAKQAVKGLLEEFTVDSDVESYIKDLNDIKTTNQNKNKISKSQTVSPQCSKYNNLNDKNERPEKPKEISLNENCYIKRNMNVGFQTANGQQVSISAKARETVENIFKEFNSAIDVENCEKDLREMKLKLQNKNIELAAKSDIATLNEANSSPKKRKHSIDNCDLESLNETPPVKLFKSNLESSKSLLAEQSLKSPLMSATRSTILRKNLLSLTKKRKNRENYSTKPTKEIPDIIQETNDMASNAATPLKSAKSMEPAPVTPNLKEFLTNASLTSTPRINDRLHTFEDSDLKPIVWKNNDSLTNKPANNSLNATKLSQNSASNISFNSPIPTAKERIGRLKMYGKAPDVSPILIETNHNCRPSGLRRTRSMLKKTEN